MGRFIPFAFEVTYVMGPLFFQQERIFALVLIRYLLWGWARGSVLPLKVTKQHQEAGSRRYTDRLVSHFVEALTPSNSR
jgi:hypothetical protein